MDPMDSNATTSTLFRSRFQRTPLDRKMDWERFCKDPNLWITEEEWNPAKRHVTGATRNRRKANKLERERKTTLHWYKKNQHLIFKYHYKASARRDHLNKQSRTDQGC
jgi:hypothetical protein